MLKILQFESFKISIKSIFEINYIQIDYETMESVIEFPHHNLTTVTRTGRSGSGCQIWTSDEILPSVILSKFPSPDWALIAPYKIGKNFAANKSRIFFTWSRFRVYFSSVFRISLWFFSMIFVFFGIVNNTNIASRYFSLLVLNK